MYEPKNIHEVQFWGVTTLPFSMKRYGMKWCCDLHKVPIKLIKQTSKCYGIGKGCFWCGRDVEVRVTHTSYYSEIN